MTDKPYRRPIDDYAPLIGNVTIAWNDIQFGIFSIFQALLPADKETAKLIFFSIRSDNAQRDLATNVIQKFLPKHSEDLANRLVKKIGVIGKLAGKRNDTIHAMWLLDWPSMAIRIFQEHRLDNSDIKSDLIKLTDELTAHAIDIFSMRHELVNLPHFHRLAMARALGEVNPDQQMEKMAIPAGFGLIGEIPEQ